MKKVLAVHLIAMAMILSLGCSGEKPDERLTRLVEQTTTQQAEQNREMAKVSQQAAGNHRRIVEAVAQSRQQIKFLEQDMQRQRVELDLERRELAEERHRESLLVPIYSNLGLLLVASLPLVLCWYLLHGLRNRAEDDEVSEVLIREFLSDERPALAAPATPTPALEQGQPSGASEDEQDLPF